MGAALIAVSESAAGEHQVPLKVLSVHHEVVTHVLLEQ